MIKRIVKLTFQASYIEDFKIFFSNNQSKIVAFEGCQHVELWQDKHNPGIFFTYSIWNSEADLDAYRNSDFFKAVWRQTKAKFKSKAEAWTVA